MTNTKTRKALNVQGKFYVNDFCIDCMACKQLASKNFEFDSKTETFYVCKQPETAEELDAVLEAMDSCPCGCIGDDGDSEPTVYETRQIDLA